MIVYGSSVSPYVRKVLFFMGEKGLVAEHLPIRFHDPLPAFQAASPFGLIPAFADEDFTLSDSTAICHYLERKHPNPALLPDEAAALGRVIWLEEFLDTSLTPTILKLFRNLVLKPKVLNIPPDMAEVDAALLQLPALLDYLQAQINGPFLVGDSVSLADIAAACPFLNLKMAGHALDAERWPVLAAYIANLLARPAHMCITDKR